MHNHRYKNMPNYLQKLEAHSIKIILEAVSSFKNLAMLYSIGKDSSVLLHLIKKAFYPAPPPFPLVHVNTKWKFKEMISFRDKVAQKANMHLIVYENPDITRFNLSPFTHGSAYHTDIAKTQALKKMLDIYRFDGVFGGARRDEESSRAKERIFSFRDNFHRWEPKNQRPELWDIYNTRLQEGQSMRIFPLSDWTELDIWEYIFYENIEIVELYFAKKRIVVPYCGTKILVDDDRVPKELLKNAKEEMVRFRTLGCYPLTGAINSNASDLLGIISEIKNSNFSERQGRLIDGDGENSMEIKKQDGYF